MTSGSREARGAPLLLFCGREQAEEHLQGLTWLPWTDPSSSRQRMGLLGDQGAVATHIG